MDSNRSALALRTSIISTLRYGLLLIPLVFLALFYFYPLFSILELSFIPAGRLDLSGLWDVFGSAYYRSRLWFTTWQAALSTALTILLALPGAYIFTRFQFPGKTLLMSFATLPFVLPTVVVAAAFKALIGENGLVNDLLMWLFALDRAPIQLERTVTLILIVHVFYNYAVALRMIAGFWANQSARIEEAARVLGCSGWRLWWEIRLPMLRPAILAAAVLVFIFTYTSFGVILILGGPRYATLEVEIFRSYERLNLQMAAALSVLQISFMLVMMMVYTRLQRHTQLELQPVQQVARPPRTLRQKAFVGANLALMTGLLFTPLMALVLRSFMGRQGFSLANYSALTQNPRGSILFVPPIEAVTNSLGFAVFTTLLAVSLGLLTAYLLSLRGSRLSRLLDPIFMLPLATSAVTLGLGFILALDSPPLNLRTSILLIPLAHTLVALPFVVRSVLPALRSIAPGIQESAAVLGASPWQVWRFVDLPLISRGVIVGATFAFTISMGEFGASTFIARPDTPTIPVVIGRLLGRPGGADGQALAMSVILMAVCAVSFIVIERIRKTGIGEF